MKGTKGTRTVQIEYRVSQNFTRRVKGMNYTSCIYKSASHRSVLKPCYHNRGTITDYSTLLGEVPNTSVGARRLLGRVDLHELAVEKRSLQVVVPTDRVQFSVRTTNGRREASRALLQRGNDLVQGVLTTPIRRNPRVCEPRVRGERLEQLDDVLEVRHSLGSFGTSLR